MSFATLYSSSIGSFWNVAWTTATSSKTAVVGSLCTVIGSYVLWNIGWKYYAFIKSPLRQLPRPRGKYGFLFGTFLEVMGEPFLEPHKRYWKEAQEDCDAKHLNRTENNVDNRTSKNEDTKTETCIPFMAYSWIFGQYSVALFDADLYQEVLCDTSYSKENRRFLKRYEILARMMGQGLVTLEGPDWSRHRRIIHPSFQTSLLEQTLDETVPKLTWKLIESWKKGAQKVIDVDSHLQALTLDVIGQAGFSYEFDALKAVDVWANLTGDEESTVQDFRQLSSKERNEKLKPIGAVSIDHPFILALSQRLLKVSPLEIILATLKALWLIPILMPFISGKQRRLDEAADAVVLQAKEKLRTQGETTSKSLLQLLLNASSIDEDTNSSSGVKRNGLSSMELRDEVKTFLIAGHETTQTWLYWALHVLSNDPIVQEKLYQDVMKHRTSDNNHKNSGTETTTSESMLGLQQVQKMEYLDAFLNEVLRLHPPVGFLFRYTTKEEVWHGYKIPVNTRVALLIHLLHRHPKYWGPDAEVFRPERWLDADASKTRHPYCFIPFSAGVRNCIGYRFARIEAKIIMANIISTFKIRPASCMPKDIELASIITVKSKPRVKICVEDRSTMR